MRERNLLDDIGEIEQASKMTPEERFVRTVALSDFCMALLLGNKEVPKQTREAALAEKSRLWVRPLRAVRS